MPTYTKGKGKYHGKGGGKSKTNKHLSNKQKNQSATPTKQKKFLQSVAGKPKGPTFATVRDAFILKMQRSLKKGHDIAASLRAGKRIDFGREPTLKTSAKDPKEPAYARENRQHEMEYKLKLDRYHDRVEQQDENEKKAYAELMSSDWTDEDIITNIQQHKDFETESLNNPYQTLKEIQQLWLIL